MTYTSNVYMNACYYEWACIHSAQWSLLLHNWHEQIDWEEQGTRFLRLLLLLRLTLQEGITNDVVAHQQLHLKIHLFHSASASSTTSHLVLLIVRECVASTAVRVVDPAMRRMPVRLLNRDRVQERRKSWKESEGRGKGGESRDVGQVDEGRRERSQGP